MYLKQNGAMYGKVHGHVFRKSNLLKRKTEDKITKLFFQNFAAKFS